MWTDMSNLNARTDSMLWLSGVGESSPSRRGAQPRPFSRARTPMKGIGAGIFGPDSSIGGVPPQAPARVGALPPQAAAGLGALGALPHPCPTSGPYAAPVSAAAYDQAVAMANSADPQERAIGLQQKAVIEAQCAEAEAARKAHKKYLEQQVSCDARTGDMAMMLRDKLNSTAKAELDMPENVVAETGDLDDFFCEQWWIMFGRPVTLGDLSEAIAELKVMGVTKCGPNGENITLPDCRAPTFPEPGPPPPPDDDIEEPAKKKPKLMTTGLWLGLGLLAVGGVAIAVAATRGKKGQDVGAFAANW